MNKYETFALSQIFHTYPYSKTYEEIIILCRDEIARESYNDSLEDTDLEDEQLVVCEKYEDLSWPDIVHDIESLRSAAIFHFGNQQEVDQEVKSWENQ